MFVVYINDTITKKIATKERKISTYKYDKIQLKLKKK